MTKHEKRNHIPNHVSAVVRIRDLEVGFRRMMNRHLDQTEAYEPITQDEILDGMAALGLSKKKLAQRREKAS